MHQNCRNPLPNLFWLLAALHIFMTRRILQPLHSRSHLQATRTFKTSMKGDLQRLGVLLQVALRWFCAKSLLCSEGLTRDLIDRIPGKQTDRKTPLGELNWIFTAITDTIAWNTLPRALFQKLFRQVRISALLPVGVFVGCKDRLVFS